MICPLLVVSPRISDSSCIKSMCAWYCIQDAETGAGACAIWNIAMLLQLWREDEAIEAERQEILANSVFKKKSG